MRKSLFAALAGLSALALSAPANAVTLGIGTNALIPGNNNFSAQLAGAGFTHYTTTGATLTLNSNATLTFEFMGSESGFFDRFIAGPFATVDFTENSTGVINNFPGGVPIGAAFFSAGSLFNLLNFSAVGGASATVGQDGFGIFYNPATLANPLTEFYLGYDDQINNIDDNHDDMIIRVGVSGTFSNPVPEPATWAMMLLGFGAIGYSMRRRRKPLLQLA